MGFHIPESWDSFSKFYHKNQQTQKPFKQLSAWLVLLYLPIFDIPRVAWCALYLPTSNKQFHTCQRGKSPLEILWYTRKFDQGFSYSIFQIFKFHFWSNIIRQGTIYLVSHRKMPSKMVKSLDTIILAEVSSRFSMYTGTRLLYLMIHKILYLQSLRTCYANLNTELFLVYWWHHGKNCILKVRHL